MNAITIHQPHASLVAVGAKTIETRSWRPPVSAIGERLVIHAGAQRPEHGQQAGPYIVDGPAGTVPYLAKLLNGGGWEGIGPLPLGAVVASCVLAGVAPIGWGATGEPPFLTVKDGPDEDKATLHRHMEPWRDITDQLPLGDFGPGRFAWLLQDVKPTSERCPFCRGLGSVDLRRDDVHLPGPHNDCPACAGVGVCDPIPAKGRQRIWQWEPEEARA